MQSDWRWCNKCQGLAFSLNQPSVCPAGGSHDHTGSGNYALVLDDPSAPGQSGWKWCMNCQGLAFAEGLISPSFCPAGGSHDHSASGNYTLAHNDPSAPGQSDWRWCRKCQGLAFSLNQSSVCPAGGGHDHSGSGNYTLAYAAEEEPDVASGLVSEEEEVPFGAASGKYWPGEVEASQKSGGHVLDAPPADSGGPGAALLSDFLPDSSELRPAHRKLIGLIRTRMGWSSGRHDGHLLEVYGYMDEIEGFLSGSTRLDTARAFEVKRALDPRFEFTSMGPSTIPRPGADDPEVLGLGIAPECVVSEGSTPKKRSAGRAVAVNYNAPARNQNKPQWPTDKKSKKWAIAQEAALSVVLGGGLVDVAFFLKNLDSGQEYAAHFSGRVEGDNMIGVGGSMSVGHAHWFKFSTNTPISAAELDGPNAVYEMVAVELHPAPVGGSVVRLTLGRPTIPRPIELRLGPELSASATPLSGFLAKGTFTVLGPK